MSSSSEARIVRGASAATATGLATPELRGGDWTRLGGARVLGDPVTEQTLASLASTTRSAARSQGYAIGWAQGRRTAAVAAASAAQQAAEQLATEEQRREAEHRAAVAALELATRQVHEALAALGDRVEERSSELALELTRELVGHELAVSDRPGAHVVRRALALVPDRLPVRIRVHPDTVASLDGADLSGATLVADPSLATGDALVETEDHVLDLRIDTALDRVREVLG